MSCRCNHFLCQFFKSFYIFLTIRTIDHTSLAETASTDTASLYFQNNTILCRFNKWNNWLFRINRSGKIHIHLFLYRCWNVIVFWSKCSNCTIFLIRHLIQRWYINSFDFSRFMQEFLTGIVTFLHLFIQIKESIILCFALSDIKAIKKVCNRLRIISTWSACQYNWIIIFPVFGIQWNLRQIKNL